MLLNRKNTAFRTNRLLTLVVLSLFSLLAQSEPLHKQSYEEILKNYTIIADFAKKSPTRPISDHLFWKYPYKIPDIVFDIDIDFEFDSKNMRKVIGDGRDIEHLNLGRTYFLDGDFENAKQVFLTGRAKFGKQSKFHRRLDFYIGLTFLHLAKQEMSKPPTDTNLVTVKTKLNNAATFLSWALMKKKNVKDALINEVGAKYYYTLALIYYNYKSYPVSYSVVQEAFDFLRIQGQTDYKAQLHQLNAEAFIKNRTYLQAVKELDKAIRLHPDRRLAPSLFARISDIYFQQNNYELAEDFYALAVALEMDSNQLSREELILRGESLFWLGQFAKSLELLEFSLSDFAMYKDKENVSDKFVSYASLRAADVYLAKGDIDKAKLRYFQTRKNFPKSDASLIAKVRLACLDLPYYKGNNVSHARNLLSELKDVPLASEAQELAFACYTSSYTKRERTKEMIAKVRDFYSRYPNSKFLKEMIPDVKNFYIAQYDKLFKKEDFYGVINYFEEHREKISNDGKNNDIYWKAFHAYMMTLNFSKASELYPKFKLKKSYTDDELLSHALFLSSRATTEKSKSLQDQNNKLGETINEKTMFNIKLSESNQTLISHLIGYESAKPHLRWVAKLVDKWMELDPNIMCGLAYTTLSKLINSFPSDKNHSAKLFGMINDHQKNKPSKPCLDLLLDLEMITLDGKADVLFGRYEGRLTWELTPQLTSYFWQVAEVLEKRGMGDASRKLLKHIVENAPKDRVEVEFAKLRLDNSKLTTESLWK